MFIKINARIEGRIQGVGFRFFAQRMADLLSITGWIRNASDGAVELEAVGEKPRIEEFILTLKQGSSLSEVKNISVQQEEVEYNNHKDFEIRM